MQAVQEQDGRNLLEHFNYEINTMELADFLKTVST